MTTPTHDRPHASEALRCRILKELRRQADLDDIAIVADGEVADTLGVSRMSVNIGVGDLIRDGRLVHEGYHAVAAKAGGKLRIVRLPDTS